LDSIHQQSISCDFAVAKSFQRLLPINAAREYVIYAHAPPNKRNCYAVTRIQVNSNKFAFFEIHTGHFAKPGVPKLGHKYP